MGDKYIVAFFTLPIALIHCSNVVVGKVYIELINTIFMNIVVYSGTSVSQIFINVSISRITGSAKIVMKNTQICEESITSFFSSSSLLSPYNLSFWELLL